MDVNRDQYIPLVIGQEIEGMFRMIFFILISPYVLAVAYAIVMFDAYHRGNIATHILATLGLAGCIYLLIGAGLGPTMVRPRAAHYVLVICGSGGHTGEMVRMIERSIRPEEASHRRWAIGQDDKMSYRKIVDLEDRLAERFAKQDIDHGSFDIVFFRRPRYVHQSWLTTPFTVLLSLTGIFRILITPPKQHPTRHFRFPGVIVTNGPGIGFIFLFLSRILRLLLIAPRNRLKTIFVESWARVKTLSLTGKLIHTFKLADLFLVQWEYLEEYGVVAPNLPFMPINQEH